MLIKDHFAQRRCWGGKRFIDEKKEEREKLEESMKNKRI